MTNELMGAGSRHIAIACCGLLAVACAPAQADEAGAWRPVDKRQQHRVQRFVKKFLACEELTAREALAAQAVFRGRPFALAIRHVLGRQREAELPEYRAAFLANIEQASRIEPTAVVAGNEELRARRGRIVQSARIAGGLDWLLNGAASENPAAAERTADGDPAAGEPHAEAPPATTRSSFDLQLAETEEGWIKQWLDARGFGRLAPAESALVAEVNRRRQKEGLEPLAVDYKLCIAARDHSLDMSRERFFSHRSKLPGKATHADRAARFGAISHAENIANSASPAEAMDLWMASSGHRRNILTPEFRRVGIGLAGRKYTMLFGG